MIKIKLKHIYRININFRLFDRYLKEYTIFGFNDRYM